ncbi:MAG: MFS transporter [Candidatus Hodarchaeota archaeon]
MEELSNRNTFRSYLFFWSGQLFSLMGSLVVQFVITWWVTEATGSAVYLSIGMFLYFLPMVIVTPIAGVFTDRWNRKLLLGIADSLQALVTVWIIVLFYLNQAYPLLVILIASLRGLCQAFHMPTVSAIVPTMVPKDRLSRINGINYLFTSLIQLAGPVIGAVFLIFFPIKIILWMDVITFGIAIIPLLMIKIPQVRYVKQKKNEISFVKELKEGIITIKMIPGMLVILFLSMFLNFLITPVEVLLPYYIKVTHLGAATDLALIMVLFNSGMILGGVITTLKKEWKHKITTYFLGLMIVMTIFSVLGFAPTGFFLLMGLSASLIGLILPISNTIYMTIIQTTVPPDKMGRVSSVDQSLSMAIYPIGTIISGPLAEIIGIQNLFIYSAFIGVFITFLAWRFMKMRYIDFEHQIELTAEKISNIKI